MATSFVLASVSAEPCEHRADLDAAIAKIHDLEDVVANSRSVVIAIGIVMATYKLSDDAAFDLLVMAGEKAQRPLRDIADDVARTGQLVWGPGMLDKSSAARRQPATARRQFARPPAAEVAENR